MKRLLFALGIAACSISASIAQTPTAPSPGEIVAAAPATDWTTIAASDLLVMDLVPGPRGPRRVVIQLMPVPISAGWVRNIRKLADAGWWDGTSINRVQDNYVVQWGDATEKKPLPDAMETMTEADYVSPAVAKALLDHMILQATRDNGHSAGKPEPSKPDMADAYAAGGAFLNGWPLAIGSVQQGNTWPVHCYGMVGVGRNLSPDTGSGAELYAVIGHAPRHLDRNIALVGRVIEGIEHLSSLLRGTGPLGFYEKEEERVPILSARIGTEIADLPTFEYLSTDSRSFATYADARANRRDPFFIRPAGGADICNIPVPMRRAVP